MTARDSLNSLPFLCTMLRTLLFATGLALGTAEIKQLNGAVDTDSLKIHKVHADPDVGPKALLPPSKSDFSAVISRQHHKGRKLSDTCKFTSVTRRSRNYGCYYTRDERQEDSAKKNAHWHHDWQDAAGVLDRTKHSFFDFIDTGEDGNPPVWVENFARDVLSNYAFICRNEANKYGVQLRSIMFRWNYEQLEDGSLRKTTLRYVSCLPTQVIADSVDAPDECPTPSVGYFDIEVFAADCTDTCEGKDSGNANAAWGSAMICTVSDYGWEVHVGNGVFEECPSGVVAENDRNRCIVTGCKDADMDNYNAEAEQDDGTCTKAGCMTEGMDNYDAKVTTDDGTCFKKGCMTVGMDNYDSTATVEDVDSCVKAGCKNSLSSNFDPAATVDDGSCLQPPGSKNVYDECARLKTAYEEEQWVVDKGNAHRAEGNEAGAACCLENPSDDCLEWSQEYQRLQCCDGRVCKKVTCDLGYEVQHLDDDECNQFCSPINCIRFGKDQDDGHKVGDVDWVKMAKAKAIRAACVKEDMEKVVPPCQKWFDGCNTCIASSDGGLPSCTKEYCSVYAEAQCLD